MVLSMMLLSSSSRGPQQQQHRRVLRGGGGWQYYVYGCRDDDENDDGNLMMMMMMRKSASSSSSSSSSTHAALTKNDEENRRRRGGGGFGTSTSFLLNKNDKNEEENRRRRQRGRREFSSSSSTTKTTTTTTTTSRSRNRSKSETSDDEKKENKTTINVSYPAFQVWGSNTAVGKTLVSGGVINAAAKSSSSSCLYLKPVQTGFPEDSDAQFVAACVHSGESESGGSSIKRRVTTGAHAAKCRSVSTETTTTTSDTMTTDDTTNNTNIIKNVWCHTEFAWKIAAGPHVAEKLEGRPVTDEDVVNAVRNRLEEFYNNDTNNNNKFALVETAGGVASPSSSGNLQSNVLARCRLPAILVGDGRLGGVSVTLTSYESLLLRGYDVACIVLSNEGYDNHEAIAKNVPSNVKVFSLPKLPHEGDGQKWVHAQNDAFRDMHAISFNGTRNAWKS
ncbi:unnamed protein product [Bathycoccus prasinos]